MSPALRVTALLGSALVEDAGRRHREVGVPASGAFDRYAHRAAEALVGGAGGDAALEIVGAIEVVPDVPVTCAVTGTSDVALDGAVVPAWTALAVAAGQVISIRTASCGYLSVAGGLQVAPVLGSRSTCLLGPIGPAPVRRGDALPLAPRCTCDTIGDYVRPVPRTGPVRVVPGPHRPLAATTVRVLETSRIGIRVAPATDWAPARRAAATLPSLGVVPGTIQALPSGEWVVLGPDAGTMGGYPVVGVVASADTDRWAHLMAGDEVELVPISPDVPAPPRPVPVVVRAGRIQG